MKLFHFSILFIAFSLVEQVAGAQSPPAKDQPWQRHTIDDSARGADGVRLADANGDGLLDIATGWEEAGLIKVYFNPGNSKAERPWPAVVVGRVKSPEDAVLVDVDGDGAMDVVSCCEGSTRAVFVHWAPERARLFDESAWKTEPFPALSGKQRAMYCLPLQVDGQRGVDLVIGGKGEGAEIGWLQSPERPRDLAAWKWHPIYQAGWTMSLVAADIDSDGDQDILASDRKGKNAGCLWLENPGAGELQLRPWKINRVGPVGPEVMFLAHADLDGDSLHDVLVPTYAQKLLFLRRDAGSENQPAWQTHEIPWPAAIGKGKAARIADIDLDSRPDVVLSAEDYQGTSGLIWLSPAGKTLKEGVWTRHEISGSSGRRGMKMDDIQLLDLDGDSDLDILTTEERTGFGVTWFENPTK